MSRHEFAGRRCYIISPPGADALQLRALLTDLGVESDIPSELPPPGDTLPTEIRQRIKSSDFVLAIFTSDAASNANVMLEVGMAVGLRKPIFVVTERMEELPYAVQTFPYFIGEPSDVAALRFHLRVFLLNMKTPLGTRKPAANVPQAEPTSETMANLRRRLVESQPTEVSAIRILGALLQGANIRTVLESRLDEGLRPDIIAWPDDFPAELGVPLIVEVKRGAKHALAASEQVSKYMRAVGARTGLLVFLHGDEDINVRMVPEGYVFTLSINTLFDVVERGVLASSLREARNKFVHGAP